ncbi:cytochrome P450 [Streptomyces venezuelae]|uniref:Cytochrome P450 n=1 Tax=Streptomyces venezuelae TaxID=54571 RepID=A0A5P2BS71_STRVZ|nr:cytochrome P450 [Streptomyces venezuelae]
MTETTNPIQSTDSIESDEAMGSTGSIGFPQDRTCPYHPPTAYAPLLDDAPFSRVRLFDGRSVWLVTGRAAARELLIDPRLSADRENEAFPVPTERFARLRDRRVALLGVDDPKHNVQRRMLIPSFSVKRIAAMRPQIQATVDLLLDAMVEQGPSAELVSAFALPVPSMVICGMLGVPYGDHEFFEEQSRRLLRGPTPEDTQAARDAMDAYFYELIDKKREEPGDGLLDELIAGQLASGEVDPEELVRLAAILLVAGHETTANMISLGTFTLLQHPGRLAELRAGLRADPPLLPAAVEELLRFLSIADGLLRVAKEDIETSAGTIRADDGVVFATSLINRDDTVFEGPEDLDWHRPDRHHLAFGFGIHQCLGQNLARAELEIALGTLFERFPGLRLAAPPQDIPFKPGDTIQGMLELPVTW